MSAPKVTAVWQPPYRRLGSNAPVWRIMPEPTTAASLVPVPCFPQTERAPKSRPIVPVATRPSDSMMTFHMAGCPPRNFPCTFKDSPHCDDDRCTRNVCVPEREEQAREITHDRAKDVPTGQLDAYIEA